MYGIVVEVKSVFDACSAPGGFSQILALERASFIYSTSLRSGLKQKFGELRFFDDTEYYFDPLLKGDGDLTNEENINDILSRYSGFFDLFVSDGGVDLSFDYDKQEEINLNLKLSELRLAVECVKIGGVSVVCLLYTSRCV